MAISESVPTYRQLDPKGFFAPNAELILEGDAFEFDGTPNENMEALNEPAKKKLTGYLKGLEDSARAVAEKNGRFFSGRPKSLDVMVAEATADARRVELRPGDGGIPLMSKGITSDQHVRKVTLETGPRVIPRGRRAASAQEAPI